MTKKAKGKGGVIPVNKILKENVRVWSVDERTGVIKKMQEARNDLQYAMCDALIRRLFGYPNYNIQTMYMEYANAAFVPVPAAPVFDRDDQLEYYLGLPANRDFLRIPLVISPNYQTTDSSHYDSNMATVYAMSSGHTEGHNGEPFNPTVQSTVIGIALVVSPEPDNQSEDIVVARAYLDAGIEVEAHHAIGISHTIYAAWS